MQIHSHVYKLNKFVENRNGLTFIGINKHQQIKKKKIKLTKLLFWFFHKSQNRLKF